MCGVIGLVYERERDDLGRIAEGLLQALEYRGYDSTGAAIQGAGSEDVDLRKGVGAPSVMATELGIVDVGGQVLCAQVRWATFGAVDDVNSQPHVVRCHEPLYGAHNGNVTNCDQLKSWLRSHGHDVRSDNDGEMVVHVVEHHFAGALEAQASRRRDPRTRRRCMRTALVDAASQLEGSFAAVVVDPVTRTLWAIKHGSSLYFGIGEDDRGGRFAIASSDLSAVLKLTRVLVPLSEGELVEFDACGYAVHSTADGEPVERTPARSRLRAKDIGLRPPFRTFMEQEIHAQQRACRDVIRLLGGGSAAAVAVGARFASLGAAERELLDGRLQSLLDQYSDQVLRRSFSALVEQPVVGALLDRLPVELREAWSRGDEDGSPRSSEAALFTDLRTGASTERERLAACALDALVEHEEASELAAAAEAFQRMCVESIGRGGRIFLVCCGTSFHAAKAAALFFAELAAVDVLPLLPGEFRGQYARTLRDGDLFVAVSQSGETKDVVDAINGVIASGKDVGRVALVNNVSSTLAQEKCDLLVPLRCGPEIAVPATKSFVNQLTVFYGLAAKVGEVTAGAAEARVASRLPEIPELIGRTLEQTHDSVVEAAELMYLAPSVHLLATRLLAVAKEGALKVREVVLNHTEGFEGSEFKHGPNTILGFNTLWGPLQLRALMTALEERLPGLLRAADDRGVDREQAVIAMLDRVLADGEHATTEPAASLAAELLPPEDVRAALYADYPLVYITGPETRDVDLTISQINTHKIRGSSTVVVAEEDARLRAAAVKPPADNPLYRSVYVALPSTGCTLLTVFSATVALQRLALEMSERKAAYLDSLGFREHGVHPDVPKNVSKSITVD